MPRSHRPRKRYVPKRVDWDPMDLASSRAALLTVRQRADLTTPIQQSLRKLKTGTGTMAEWCNLADALNVAERLCDLGIANDHRHCVLNGQAALAALHARHAQRGTWTMRGDEVLALEGNNTELGAVEVHAIQLQHCSQGELAEAITRAVTAVRQALAGNAAADAVICVGALRFEPHGGAQREPGDPCTCLTPSGHKHCPEHA